MKIKVAPFENVVGSTKFGIRPNWVIISTTVDAIQNILHNSVTRAKFSQWLLHDCFMACRKGIKIKLEKK